jgi:hypothetical protein
MVQESGVRSQESGVRSQESGVRNQESGARKKLRQRVSQGEHSDKLLYSNWTKCRLEKREERRGNFRNLWNNTGMSMKTKDELSAACNQAAMSMKTKEIPVYSGNVIENTGS